MAHHSPFQSLAPLAWSSLTPESLPSLLGDTFSNAQILIDSIPPLPSSSSTTGHTRTRSQTAPVTSQPCSESLSPDVLKLRKDWTAVKPMAASSNPHNITVYKLSAKDGKGAWFARRSVHHGIHDFEKWEEALRKEFGETLKRGEEKDMPGQGNIRGIGAEKRVERVVVEGVGLMEVFLVSARFPGPTTPRDFVALHMTPESAKGNKGERQFMLVSRPCEHDECPPRSGFIRGRYESVEIIREVKVDGKKLGERMTRSSTNLGRNGESHVDGEGQGHGEETAIEWLMVTRSDPGGSVPRFMVEKGTPGGIVSDAGRFLEWFEQMFAEEEESEESEEVEEGEADLDGLDDRRALVASRGTLKQSRKSSSRTVVRQGDHGTNEEKQEDVPAPSGFYGMIASALEAAGSVVANRVATFAGSSVGTNSDVGNLDDVTEDSDDDDDASSQASFASAKEESTHANENSPPPFDGTKTNGVRDTDAISTRSSIISEGLLSNESTPTGRAGRYMAQHEKEVRKLQARMRKAQEKLERNSRRHRNQSSGEKEEEALAKLREKHEREVAKQEEKYRRELQRLAEKRLAEERKAEERRKKQVEREEKANVQMELERARAERDVALLQVEILTGQVGELQAQNTKLVARLGKAGIAWEG
ncbi:hypothetical protein QBC38DRAFT_468129 [Podospora fimiseda]|uniref:DUF3074 domain-containing protein n=1 Tax=Podospora fimiseda TaxID=252190 RepID=A0AAN7H7B1_9PEZI|nr:hypothetical protein QBC38DRAFT_468129 [Podospora fimiseda]